MEPVRLAQVVAWTGGVLLRGDEELLLTSVSTDSRTLAEGACFIPLIGERFDGHDFLEEAVTKGAQAVLVQEGRPWSHLPVAVAAVRDTRRALVDLARGYRMQFDLPVVAVTGSNGKTTTKEMIAAILGRSRPVLATEKNYNNEIGLSHTLFKLERSHRAAVVEMGMRGRGEIALLASVARPNVGVVTNVGPVHVERLGSVDAVAEAKAELVEALGPDGWAVLNADDPKVGAMAARSAARVVTFGLSEGADVRAEEVRLDGEGKACFVLCSAGGAAVVQLGIPGRHSVMNALAAAAAALALGAGLEDVASGLAEAEGGEMRMEMVRLGAGIRLLNDAYNASPLSMRAALDTLAALEAERKVAVLGDMLELGKFSAEAHREAGRRAAAAGVELLITVGKQARETAAGAVEAGLDQERVLGCETAEEAAEECAARVRPNDLVLLKGSRGVRLERVAEALLRRFGHDVDEGSDAAR